MSQQETKIKCPNCNTEIDVGHILHHQISEQLKKQYDDNLTQEKSKLEKEKRRLAEKIEQQDKQIREQLKKQEATLKEKLRKELNEEQSDAIASLRKEINEKSQQVKELNLTKIKLEQAKREKEALRDSIKAEEEKEFNRKLKSERERIQQEANDKNALEIAEYKKQLEDQKKLTEEMKRKQEQGSMQTQGEVQELAIEDWLADKFHLDTIEEIKKGERGADCLQIVNTHSRQNCGTIYYESKRTKNFQNTWIEKFKSDMREKNADIGVLVTESMPKDMERLGQKNGIWICSFNEFKGLCSVLRESLIRLSNAISVQENKGDKMSMLYHFLTSNEFRLQIEAIVEGFSQMQEGLNKEKNAMNRIWNQREKQIQKVIDNTSGMYGSIQGIAGNAVRNIRALELSADDEDESEPTDKRDQFKF